VIGTASGENLEFVRGLGADEVVDYRAQRFEDVALEINVVFDTGGGPATEGFRVRHLSLKGTV
jgi:NADPH:quinone reductase-like Zn-dependent oxidoreductase